MPGAGSGMTKYVTSEMGQVQRNIQVVYIYGSSKIQLTVNEKKAASKCCRRQATLLLGRDLCFFEPPLVRGGVTNDNSNSFQSQAASYVMCSSRNFHSQHTAL